ncbi:imm11 family protein [Hyalangium gracile]|uniref:imm11 family protein n=1 Tax=Hyalangium gracile TaxID=394092 RepID=UPI001CCE4A9E|nr:DUF1629 domain-containing protein [Hyalangium gracile]
MPRYYDLVDDRRSETRWHLRSPLDEHGSPINPWQFFEGRRLELQEVIRFPVRPAGEALDFTWAAFSIPIVHHRFVQLFQRLRVPDVQFIPVQVEAHPGPYFILNALRLIRCIDDARCAEVQYWKPEDGKPEKTGRYRFVAGMRIDATKVGDARIFRTWGWDIALILSEDIKEAIEAAGLSGARFVEV